VKAEPQGIVAMRAGFGGRRIVDMLVGEAELKHLLKVTCGFKGGARGCMTAKHKNSNGGSSRLLRYLVVLVPVVFVVSLRHAFGFMLAGEGFAPEVPVVGAPSLASLSAFAVLGLGFLFGLKHATEVDHIVAVSTIVSEHGNVLRSALVGGLWGIGHTLSLVIVGAVVLMLRVTIPESVSNWLEFGVALMIIGLGASAIFRALRRRADVHVHQHSHDDVSHIHIHFHEHGTEHARPVTAHSHAISRIGIKPLLVGAMHGLAGSAALTLLVLTQIESTALGLLYLCVFGIGSVLGMLLMSGLIGLPFALTARRLSHLHYGVQAGAGAFSVAFGLWYAYQTGLTSGLWGMFG
jgi:ABC-type nickel/cobalt efflux system permease component RcnA